MSTDADAVDERTERDVDTAASAMPRDDEATDAAPPTRASAASPTSPSRDDLDDGTPESDADPESDASDSEADDAPGTVIAPAAPGPISPEGRPHRRRRTDPVEPVDPVMVAPHAPRGRAGWIVTSVLLFVLLGLSVALNWHLWNTTEDWQARADEVTEVNYDLGELFAREQQTTQQLENEIDLLSQQLATSNQTVTDLSAEKASTLDQNEFATQQIEQLTESLTTAAGVANALNRCADGQQQLITYLEDPENYDPDELTDFATSVEQLCAAAENSNEQLRQALTE